jgi:hypothetical protein
VAASVRQASDGQQQPWTEGALDGEFYFVPPSGAAAAAMAGPAPAPALPGVAAPSRLRAESAERLSPAPGDAEAIRLLRFQGIVFEVSAQRMVVRSVPAGRRIGVRPGDEVLGCQQADTLIPWDQFSAVTGSLGPRCKPVVSGRGRSHLVLSIRREGETLLRTIALAP